MKFVGLIDGTIFRRVSRYVCKMVWVPGEKGFQTTIYSKGGVTNTQSHPGSATILIKFFETHLLVFDNYGQI